MGDRESYLYDKKAYAYKLYKEHRFYRKARAVILKDKKILLLKVKFLNGDIHYLFPGGGVDEGENIRQAVVREAYEEYGARVKPIKFLCKQYYKHKTSFEGVDFYSNRIDNYYICHCLSIDRDSAFGIQGEFDRDDRVYEKVEISLDELKNISHHDLNSISKKNYQKLIDYMEKL